MFLSSYRKKQIKKFFFGKIIIITGASSGFGKAMAITLGDLGAKIFLVARRENELLITTKLINSHGIGEAFPIKVDVTEENQVINLFNIVKSKFNRLDILISNAGIIDYCSVKDYNLELDKKIMNINYHGSALCIREATKIMVNQGFGHIFVTNSVAGLVSPPFMSSYNASKHALASFTASAKAELYNNNIIFTSFHAGDFDSTEIDKGKNIPNFAFNKYRWSKISDMVQAALYAIQKRKRIYVFPRIYYYLLRLLQGIWPGLIIWACSMSVKKDKEN